MGPADERTRAGPDAGPPSASDPSDDMTSIHPANANGAGSDGSPHAAAGPQHMGPTARPPASEPSAFPTSAPAAAAPAGPRPQRVRPEEVQWIQNLIERCLAYYLNQQETEAELQRQARVPPAVTALVWRRLEEENPTFFSEYYSRVRIKEQVVLFNHYLEQHVS